MPAGLARRCVQWWASARNGVAVPPPMDTGGKQRGGARRRQRRRRVILGSAGLYQKGVNKMGQPGAPAYPARERQCPALHGPGSRRRQRPAEAGVATQVLPPPPGPARQPAALANVAASAGAAVAPTGSFLPFRRGRVSAAQAGGGFVERVRMQAPNALRGKEERPRVGRDMLSGR